MATTTDHSCCDPEFVEEALAALPEEQPSGTEAPPALALEAPPADPALELNSRGDEAEMPACCATPASTASPEAAATEGTTPLAASAAHQSTAAAGKQPHFSLKSRASAFLSIVVLVLATGVWLVRPMDMGPEQADYTVEMSMSGFSPGGLRVPASHDVKLRLVNKESPFHASGALHQFAIDALGINEKLDAKQVRVITIPAQKQGVYTFYCDVCCGGQKSPNMRGTLTFY